MSDRKQEQAWVESQRAANEKAGKRNRDAITGKYVDDEHVKAHPDTTVTESGKACRCDDLEHALYMLKLRVKLLEEGNQ